MFEAIYAEINHINSIFPNQATVPRVIFQKHKPRALLHLQHLLNVISRWHFQMVFLMLFDILAKTAPADVSLLISTSSLCFSSLQYWWENAVVWWSFINVSGVTISLQYWWGELRCWRRSHRHNNTCNNATPKALAFHLIPFDNGIILIRPSNPFCFSFFYFLVYFIFYVDCWTYPHIG